jgi:hypothetical protein
VSERQDTTPVDETGKGRHRVFFAVLGIVVVVLAVTAAVVVIGDRNSMGSASRTASAAAATPPSGDHLSQAILVRAVHDLKKQYGFLDSYAFVTPPTLAQLDPGLQFVDGVTPADEPSKVSVATGDESATAAVRSPDGTCWYALDAEPGATVIAQDDLPGPAMYFNMKSGGACRGADAPESDWGQTFPQP